MIEGKTQNNAPTGNGECLMSLQAGQNVPLTRENPALNHTVVSFGWNIIQPSGPQIEVVPSVIMVGDDGRALGEDYFLFFNQLAPTENNGEVVFVDNGDDKDQLDVLLRDVPAKVTKFVFFLYINPSKQQPGTFRAVRDPYIRLSNGENGAQIISYHPDLSTLDTTRVDALMIGELYRHGGEWKFRALGQGYTTGVAGVGKDFGVDV